LPSPGQSAHRYDHWRAIAQALGIELPALTRNVGGKLPRRGPVVIHSGAAQPVRVWPLERFLGAAQRLRAGGRSVRILCDATQLDWWRGHGEKDAGCAEDIGQLLAALNGASAFIGNDSGPGHLAAIAGVPTFTIFGPQLPEWFAPIHPAAEWVEGSECPYKPCFDSCRFEQPNCIRELGLEKVWARLLPFVERHCVRA
ncbi:MAG: glycosyltransferase family 9 protein, partial [Verrucomicrobiota bacterium]